MPTPGNWKNKLLAAKLLFEYSEGHLNPPIQINRGGPG